MGSEPGRGPWLRRRLAMGQLSLLAALVGTVLLSLDWQGSALAQQTIKTRPSLDALELACREARAQGDLKALKLLQLDLLRVRPAPQPLAVVLANADALMRCGAPDSALLVLNRYSPSPGAEQVQWLLLQWRAANGALDHRLAAEALRRLVSASGRNLEALLVPVAQDDKGRWQTRSALDLLAAHLEALGQRDQAAELLLSGRATGVVAAQRLSQAVSWSLSMSPQLRQRWLEQALAQAAAAGAWGLAAAVLDQQLALLADQPAAARQKLEERRRRLSRRLDDAATLNPETVRSPRAPGGHAAAVQP
ncbi:MAG: hypothetical protein EBZ51_05975 [Synechococcaceae bacterium WB9_2_112]|nr:hypothetical protein [Synechococcaceae bacterium WB9_2_112]